MLLSIRILLCIFAATGIFNAVWMLVAPENWYHELPAHVPEYGALNIHFIRDVGVAFLISGIGLIASVPQPVRRRSFVLFAVLFNTGHAIVHLFEAFSGGAAMHLWKEELLTIYFPAVLLIAITLFLYRQPENRI